jgi:hypothetical protein
MNYGECEKCGAALEPEFFTEIEYNTSNGIMYPTGRKRRAVNVLYCPNCFIRVTVDDNFDGAWR